MARPTGQWLAAVVKGLGLVRPAWVVMLQRDCARCMPMQAGVVGQRMQGHSKLQRYTRAWAAPPPLSLLPTSSNPPAIASAAHPYAALFPPSFLAPCITAAGLCLGHLPARRGLPLRLHCAAVRAGG